MNKTKVNLLNNLILKSKNIEYNDETLKDYLDNNKLFACYKNNNSSTVYNNGDPINFATEVVKNTSKIVKSGSNFLINHTGYLIVSFNVWLNTSGGTGRPILRFRRSDNTDFIVCIDDNSSAYASLSAANCIIPVTSGETFELICETQTPQFYVDKGASGTNSYITLELI